ncbi:Protein kinase domain [Fusarium oxysporum f. sp. vasinfectum]|nr:Protein kinase domain [Fusarium oxysporum f. sp. vasinfectum]
MASSPSSSQATNEDPHGPLTSACQATITLTPQNAEAKLAFTEVVDWLLDVSQADDSQAEKRVQASNHVSTSSRQIRDQQVYRLMKQIQTGHLSSSSPSSSGRDIDTSAGSGTYIHTGCYFIDLSHPPANEFRGWIAGRRSIKTHNDLILCLDNSALHGIRQHHAAFQVHETGRILVQKISDRGVVEVDGDVLGLRELRVLNKHTSSIRLGQLKYQIEYTRFSATQEHSEAISEYIGKFYGHTNPLDISMTPTPALGNTIQIGQWTLSSAGTIGIGGSGRVSVGVNDRGDVVALKRMSVASNNVAIHRRQRILETLTQLADDADEDRIVRLIEVITDDPNAANKSADVWFVLTPFTPKTLAQYKGPFAPKLARSMTLSLLEALNFLHLNKWIHGDIKPMNIGVRKWDSDQASIVLLDTEDAIQAPRGFVSVTPGTTGTVGWLSPEREMGQFTATTDVWAVGVAAIWMLLGRHPWQHRDNPWRDGERYEIKRPFFHVQYDAARENIVNCEDKSLGIAILQMIRHPYAHMEDQRKARPTCREVIQMLRAGSATGGSGVSSQKRAREHAT